MCDFDLIHETVHHWHWFVDPFQIPTNKGYNCFGKKLKLYSKNHWRPLKLLHSYLDEKSRRRVDTSVETTLLSFFGSMYIWFMIY